MSWILTSDKHFVDLEIKKNEQGQIIEYSWIENKYTPQNHFLVGLRTNKGFVYELVILTENGLEVVVEDDVEPWSWSIVDVECWMAIESPFKD